MRKAIRAYRSLMTISTSGVYYTRDYLIKRIEPDLILNPCFTNLNMQSPKTVSLDSLFKDMQKTHTHMVIVVNEYGETAGIVTMEDILEELWAKYGMSAMRR